MSKSYLQCTHNATIFNIQEFFKWHNFQYFKILDTYHFFSFFLKLFFQTHLMLQRVFCLDNSNSLVIIGPNRPSFTKYDKISFLFKIKWQYLTSLCAFPSSFFWSLYNFNVCVCVAYLNKLVNIKLITKLKKVIKFI